MKIMVIIKYSYTKPIIKDISNNLFFGGKNREVLKFHVHGITSVQLKANMS